MNSIEINDLHLSDLKTGEEAPKPSMRAIKDMIMEHGRSLMELKGEHLAMLQMRGQGTWYFKGLPNAKETKAELSKVQKWDEFTRIIETYFNQNNDENHSI